MYLLRLLNCNFISMNIINFSKYWQNTVWGNHFQITYFGFAFFFLFFFFLFYLTSVHGFTFIWKASKRCYKMNTLECVSTCDLTFFLHVMGFSHEFEFFKMPFENYNSNYLRKKKPNQTKEKPTLNRLKCSFIRNK